MDAILQYIQQSAVPTIYLKVISNKQIINSTCVFSKGISGKTNSSVKEIKNKTVVFFEVKGYSLKQLLVILRRDGIILRVKRFKPGRWMGTG